MSTRECVKCSKPASVKQSIDGSAVCVRCFSEHFELNVHKTIVDNKLFSKGDRVAVGASGGKDSTVLAYVLDLLNRRFDYGLELFLLSIDEGIKGYRDDSLKAVVRSQDRLGMSLKVVTYKELYGWTMDEVVAKIGRKNNCTFCGVFRRQALDRGAALINVDKVATGHNADDLAETVIMNAVRGDVARLQRCAVPVIGSEELMMRVKPLMFSFEKDIVMYAYFNRLDYFSTECVYAPDSHRAFARAYIKDLIRIRPTSVLNLIRSAADVADRSVIVSGTLSKCKRCGYLTSQSLCKACWMLQGLNERNYSLGVRGKQPKEDEEETGRNCASAKVCLCQSDTASLLQF